MALSESIWRNANFTSRSTRSCPAFQMTVRDCLDGHFNREDSVARMAAGAMRVTRPFTGAASFSVGSSVPAQTYATENVVWGRRGELYAPISRGKAFGDERPDP